LIAVNRQAVYAHVARWLIHDLRNPAQALTLVAELAGDHEAVGETDLAEAIREATHHLSQSLELLDRLLRLPPEHAELAPLSLADSVGFVAALYKAHRSNVQLDASGALLASLPAVRGVAHELDQILLNLLLNAVRSVGGRDTGLVLMRGEPADGVVRLAVEDDGPGIPVELQERLFDAQATGGLGLPVSRCLAERMGGQLEWEPRESTGTRFVLTLPRWR
jgi:signal transduction histidine kinase